MALLSDKITALLVKLGGTGRSTLTSFAVLIGNGTSGITSTGPGTSGYVLTSNGAAANPSFQAPTSVTTGMILLWSGSVASIPAGWAICDGTNGTPDLRDRFVLGAGSTYAVNATGGATTNTPTITVANHTLTTAEMPAHDHDIQSNLGGSSGGLAIGTTGTITTTSSTGGGSAHNHTATSTAVPTLPPYFALAYIQKL